MTKKQRIEEKIKMLENGISATEQMTDEDCAEIYGIPKETCLTNLQTALGKAKADLRMAHLDSLTGVDKVITGIAFSHIISVEQRGDLETRMRDDDDFFEVAVWEIKAALTAAYEAGRKSK